MNAPKILDCTLRDGGYINNWEFSRNFGDALYGAVSAAGVDYIEVGFLEPGATSGLPWTNLSAEDLRSIRGDLKDGAGIAVMINYGSVRLADVPDANDYPADLIRVAAPKSVAEEATAFAAAITAKGYQTTINYMGISNYNNQEILGLVDLMNRFKDDVRYFYVADSFGSLMPKRTREIFTTLRFGTDAALGFHPHNNLQLAFANCLEAIEAGIDIVDSSVLGMGRGAGNLFTDAVVAYFETIEPLRFSLMSILRFAELFMEPLARQYKWGYSLPQLMSGILCCHPNYPTNLLKEKHNTADQIYALLQFINGDDRLRYSEKVIIDAKKRYFESLSGSVEAEACNLDMSILKDKNRPILLIAGGKSVCLEKVKIGDYISDENPWVVSINRPNPHFRSDAIFFGNQRRLMQCDRIDLDGNMLILGPTVSSGFNFNSTDDVYSVNTFDIINKHSGPDTTQVFVENSTIQAAIAFIDFGYSNIQIAGMDGFAGDLDYYYEESDLHGVPIDVDHRNRVIFDELRSLRDFAIKSKCDVGFVTKTIYSI